MDIGKIKELRLPDMSTIKLDDYNKINKGLIKQILDRHGVVLINIKDFKKFDLLKFIDEIGIPHGHDQTSKIVWDIKPGGTTGKETLARSHGTEEFTFHTDCSYEVNPPAYFALYIIEHDTKGGGHNLFVRNEAIIDELTRESFDILTNFEIKQSFGCLKP